MCSDYIPDCNSNINGNSNGNDANNDDKDHQSDVGYRGMDEDEILNREGLTPQQYLEFTERFIPENETTPARNETVMTMQRDKCSKFHLCILKAEDTNLRGSITVLLTSCLSCLDFAALLMSRSFTCLVKTKLVK